MSGTIRVLFSGVDVCYLIIKLTIWGPRNCKTLKVKLANHRKCPSNATPSHTPRHTGCDDLNAYWNASVKPRPAAAPVPRCVLTIPAVLPRPKDLPGLTFPQGNRFIFKLTAFGLV